MNKNLALTIVGSVGIITFAAYGLAHNMCSDGIVGLCIVAVTTAGSVIYSFE